MKKFLFLAYLATSILSAAQLQTKNVFEENQPLEQHQKSTSIHSDAVLEAQQNSFDNESSSAGLVGGNEQPEAPGNPGEPGEPVPIDGYLPLLLLSAAVLIFYAQRKKIEINH